MHLYKRILYFISAVILVTLAIQVYYNIKAYQAGKRRLWHEVQISMDQALDNYYIDLADKNNMGVGIKGNDSLAQQKLDSLIKRANFSKRGFRGFDSLSIKKLSDIRIFSRMGTKKRDSLFAQIPAQSRQKWEAIRQFLDGRVSDSVNELEKLTSRIIFAITTDTLDRGALTPYIEEQLKNRNIPVPFGYIFQNRSGDIQTYSPEHNTANSYSITSRSPYLPRGSSFTLYYDQVAPIILRLSLLSISLSAILVAGVIACLLFLLSIINRQKQLAELKNDLISNITHEFKTPIATIGVALEGIEHFNAENDPQKTKNYVRTSTIQLEKLNLMVEKLLETATLNGNELQLDKEEVNLMMLLQNLVNKHKSLAPKKEFNIYYVPTGRSALGKSDTVYADPFYLENALNNVLDNAVKYGGNQIKVSITAENREIMVKISDDGNQLTASQAKQVFEKFYRVPKGNTHDVKGFGIGLYYTKKIIEKHGGTITVEVKDKTTFKIILPNAR